MGSEDHAQAPRERGPVFLAAQKDLAEILDLVRAVLRDDDKTVIADAEISPNTATALRKPFPDPAAPTAPGPSASSIARVLRARGMRLTAVELEPADAGQAGDALQARLKLRSEIDEHLAALSHILQLTADLRGEALAALASKIEDAMSESKPAGVKVRSATRCANSAASRRRPPVRRELARRDVGLGAHGRTDGPSGPPPKREGQPMFQLYEGTFEPYPDDPHDDHFHAARTRFANVPIVEYDGQTLTVIRGSIANPSAVTALLDRIERPAHLDNRFGVLTGVHGLHQVVRNNDELTFDARYQYIPSTAVATTAAHRRIS
jgi:hypothetical protein